MSLFNKKATLVTFVASIGTFGLILILTSGHTDCVTLRYIVPAKNSSSSSPTYSNKQIDRYVHINY